MNWISVKDRLPDEHRRFLCMAFLVDCFVEAVCLYDYEKNRFVYEKNVVKVTHWMRLPTPPGNA